MYRIAQAGQRVQVSFASFSNIVVPIPYYVRRAYIAAGCLMSVLVLEEGRASGQ